VRSLLHAMRDGCAAAAMLASLALIAAPHARAQAVAEFYRGKQISLVTSASVGGGYDQYARLIAKHMQRHIPGEPNIIVQNMVGAEGLRAANFLYNVAAQDGTAIGGLSRNTGLARFYDFNNAGIQFDARKFHWLGSPQQEIGLFILSTKSGLGSLDDLKTRDVTVSSTAHNSPSTIYSRILNATIGTRLKPIEGYDGSQACLMALERGEVDAHVSGGSSAPFRARIAPWLDNGEAKVIMQMGMKRDPAFADVPTAIEVESAPADKQMFEIAFAEQVMGRPFVLPPGVPADRVAALRKAFVLALNDKALRAEADKMQLDVDPMSGDELQKLVADLYDTPPRLVERARQALTVRAQR